MKDFAKIIAVAAAHVLFLFGTYRSAFGRYLPYNVWTFIWFFVSTGIAFSLYNLILFRSHWGQKSTHQVRKMILCTVVAILLSLFSLYWGVVFSFNAFGT